jgi:endonuclease YncB( thermonuclease family)
LIALTNVLVRVKQKPLNILVSANMREPATRYEKTLLLLIGWGVFLWMFSFAANAFETNNCVLQGTAETVALKKVYDGDTIELTDGRKIRVLGINTPEVAHYGEALEPLALEARAAAQSFLSKTPLLKIKLGSQQQDQYKRWLAFVYTQDGENLSAYLLRQGLAAQVIIPPNVDDMECLHQEEQQARSASLGIWHHPYFKSRHANELMIEDAGFRFIDGVVGNIKTSDQAWWFTLDDEVEVKINKLALPYISFDDIKKLEGKRIMVRGWLVDKEKNSRNSSLEPKWIISIHHPFMMEDYSE